MKGDGTLGQVDTSPGNDRQWSLRTLETVKLMQMPLTSIFSQLFLEFFHDVPRLQRCKTLIVSGMIQNNFEV